MRSRVLAAIAAIAQGKPVIVTDDPDRENEGDLIIPADCIDAAGVAFMAVHCRGLVCLAMTSERLDELGIGPMVEAAGVETNFGVSIDLDVAGSTGISAADRARTIRRAVDADAKPGHFRRPGHLFPLRAVPGGLFSRRGHTEASVALARLAGRYPAAVICEILNDDGTMTRGADLIRFAEKHGFGIVSIKEIVGHLSSTVPSGPSHLVHQPRPFVHVERVVETGIPTPHGRWRTVGYRSDDGLEYVAMVAGDISGPGPVAVRMHSECLTGDVLGSHRCDCGRQLDAAMAAIERAGRGVLVYIKGHEGRGIGLLPKLQAYAMQDLGFDTVDANLALGYEVDERDYRGAVEVLRDLGLTRVLLLTNNPSKVEALQAEGLDVERVPLIVTWCEDNLTYLSTKRSRLGHHLPLPEVEREPLSEQPRPAAVR
jgi:3,4-dihydroxy 2-butanone 4-phosphate synthase/GTP cyclohydrolase II